MLETMKQLTLCQYEAALAMLGQCIEKCPEDSWSGPVCDFSFRHVCFHALFFTDLYLCGNEEKFRAQPFHSDNAEFFDGYQELRMDSGQSTATRPAIVKYLHHCRDLAGTIVNSETESSLQAACDFPWLDFSRAEQHVYNIRHIHHHAAQLSLKLRIDHGIDSGWVKSGWPQ